MFSLFHKVALLLFLSFSFAVANEAPPAEEHGAAKPAEGEPEGDKAPAKPKTAKPEPAKNKKDSNPIPLDMFQGQTPSPEIMRNVIVMYNLLMQ